MKLYLSILVVISTILTFGDGKSRRHKSKKGKVDAGGIPGFGGGLPGGGKFPGAGGFPGADGLKGAAAAISGGSGPGLPSPNCVAEVVCPGGKITHGRPNLVEVDIPGTDTSVVEVLSPHPNPFGNFKNPFDNKKIKNPFKKG